MTKYILVAAIGLAFLMPVPLLAQDGTPTPTPSSTPSEADRRIADLAKEKARLEAETAVIEARNARYAALRAAFEGETAKEGGAGGSNSNQGGNSGRPSGKITVQKDGLAEPDPQVTALSYVALSELSKRFSELVGPTILNYDRIVFYYKTDFEALSRYRLYRGQVKLALRNQKLWLEKYEELKKLEEKERAERAAAANALLEKQQAAQKQGKSNVVGIMKTESDTLDRGRGFSLADFGGMIPTAGTAIKAVADLVSLFRSDQTISLTKTTIGQSSLSAEFADKMLEMKPSLFVYNPEEFVPEFTQGDNSVGSKAPLDLCSGDVNRLFFQDIVCLNDAKAPLELFVLWASKLSQAEQSSPRVSYLTEYAKMVKVQLDLLSFDVKPDPLPPTPEGTKVQTEFRSMVRAEKLEEVLTQGDPKKIGIIVIKDIGSGGSRRENRNLLLGTKIDYSGTAVIEISLYDLDGRIRASKVLSHHTGFRKFPTQKQPIP